MSLEETLPDVVPEHDLETRVLLFSPDRGELSEWESALERLGATGLVCESPTRLLEELQRGASAALLSEEAVSPELRRDLQAIFAKEPSWSDLPVVLVGRPEGREPGRPSREDAGKQEEPGNVLRLEHPVSERTLRGVLAFLLRSRDRQYQTREHLRRQERQGLALEDSEAEFRAMFELSVMGQAQADLTTLRFVRVNRRLCEITGYSADELLGMTPQDLTHPEDRARDSELVRRVVEGQVEAWSSEKRYVRKDGVIRWVHVTGSLLKDGRGRPKRTVAVIVDVTESRAVQQALDRSRSELRAMLDSLTEAVVVADPQRRITLVNPAFTELFQYTPQEALGRTTEFLYANKEDFEEQGHKRYGTEAVPPRETYEVRYRRKDGGTFLAEAAGTQYRDRHGQLLGFFSLQRDITERKAAEEELRKRERDYRTLSENLPGIVYRVHLRDGHRMQFFNDNVESMTGYSPEELTSGGICSLDPLIVEEDRQVVVDTVKKAIREHLPFRIGYKLQTKSGEIRQFVERGRPVLGDDGAPTFLDGVIFDLTTHQRAQESLAESEERFRQLAENIEEVFFLITPDWNEILYISPAYETVWGRSCQSLYDAPRSWMDAVVEEDRQTAETAVEQGVGGLRAKGFPEYRIARPDGTIRWIEARAWPILDDSGSVYRIAGIATDITARKEAEGALSRGRDELQAVYDSTPDGLLIADAETKRFIEANPSICRMLGFTKAELLAMSVSDLHPPEALPAVLAPFESSPLGDPILIEGAPVLTKMGTILRMDISGRFATYKGRLCGIAFFHDLTKRMDMERELEEAKVAAEAASEAKSRFLANTSHDLRTPMNAILGMADLALEESLSPTVRDYLETARDAGTTLLSLLDDVLDVSRIEAGRLSLKAAPFPLRPTVEQVIKTLGLRAYEKGLELVCEWPDNSPEWVVGDPSRLRQILFNLVGNAIKFTPAGEVVVRKEVLSRDERQVELRFSVSDTGIGIAPEDQERVFRPFLQADTSPRREHAGAGLGLPIAAGLVERMGGELQVESAPGRGTTFAFTVSLEVPAQREDSTERPSLPMKALEGARVLVLADSPTNARMLKKTLAGWSMKPELAADGERALKALQDAEASGDRFDLLLAERSGSRVHGAALAREIRRRPTVATSVILMVSPHERMRNPGGCQDVDAVCLDKPVLQSKLLDALFEALGLPDRVGQDVMAETRPPLGRPARALEILLAEDSPAGQKFVQRLLSSRGHQVHVAENGEVALKMVQEGTFDVVLMDVQMPRMDGYATTSAIRALPDATKASLPILALTAHALLGESERCLAAGMDAYLSKPVDGHRLIRLVEEMAGIAAPGPGHALAVDEFLPEKPAEATLVADGAAAEGDSAPAAFDLEQAETICLGDHGIFQDLVEYFFEEREPLLALMRSALADNDSPLLLEHIHRLKNTVLFLAAAPATEALERVQDIAHSGDLNGAGEAIEHLSAKLLELESALEPHRRE